MPIDRLALVASAQFTTQLSKETFESVLGNVGTLISFRLGAHDAPVIAKQFGATVPAPHDLVNLPNYEMFVKLMIGGAQSKPFSARTRRLQTYQ